MGSERTTVRVRAVVLTREQPRPGTAIWPIDRPGRLRRPGRAPPRDSRQTGSVTRADLDKQPFDVARMFDDVATKYDLTNDVLSLGQDRQWRSRRRGRCRSAAGGACARPRGRHGNLVGPLPRAWARSWSRATSPRECSHVGKQRRPELAFVAGDGLQLPFADDSFDAVTLSFGLRNLHDTAAGLAELLRVTRPGGRLVVCEFSHPTWAPFRTVYSEYLMRALPRSLAPSRATRTPTSTWPSRSGRGRTSRAWPTSSQRSGWASVAWRNLSGGIVALHRATPPGAGVLTVA